MSKPLWTILLILTGALALWQAGTSAFALYSYGRLGSQAQVKITDWKSIPRGSKYAIQADYVYAYGGKKFTGSTQFGKPFHLNLNAAEERIKKISTTEWTAWIDPDQPAFSSLERHFPLRKTFYALCILGVFLYFVYLKFHLELLERSM